MNAPSGISPKISFNVQTDVVTYTYRSAETGKVTEQIPPAAVTSRYLAAADSGEQPAPASPRPAPAPKAAASTPASTPTPVAPRPAAITPAPAGTANTLA